MITNGFEQWLKMTKQFSAPFSELNKTSIETWQQIIGENLEIAGENFSRVSEQLRQLSQTKKPEDLIQLQKECFNQNMSASLENWQRLINLSIKNIEQLTKIYQTMHDPITSAMQKTAEKTKKHTEDTAKY